MVIVPPNTHAQGTPRPDIVWAAAVYGSSEMEQASGKAQGVYAYAPYQAYALLARPACVFGVVCARDSGQGSPDCILCFPIRYRGAPEAVEGESEDDSDSDSEDEEDQPVIRQRSQTKNWNEQFQVHSPHSHNQAERTHECRAHGAHFSLLYVCSDC